MRNTALARLAILAALSCTSCDVLDPAGDEIDETRAGYEQATYVPPFGISELVVTPHTLAIANDGTYTLDGEPASPAMLDEELVVGTGPQTGNIQLAIPADMPMEQALPLFQLLEERDYEGAWLSEGERFRNFGNGVEPGERLPGEAFFRGTVNEYEFPAFVSYDAGTGNCRTTFNGDVVSSDQLYDRSFEKLDLIVQREGGADAVLSNPELLGALVATVQTPPETPWRCVAGVTFNFVASGWPAIRYELVTDD